jgi:hypothetical protein
MTGPAVGPQRRARRPRPDGAGYVRAYPCGTDPLVSSGNHRAGQVAAANLAVVEVPAGGRVCLSSFTVTDLVVDLAGWYTGCAPVHSQFSLRQDDSDGSWSLAARVLTVDPCVNGRGAAIERR